MTSLGIWIPLALLLDGPAEPEATATRPLVTVRAVHPDRQLATLLKLFEGSRANCPAAALAAWKRATTQPKRLGKTAEAIIAMGNPAMVPEFRSLDDVVLGLRRDPARDLWLWRATLPHDDGTIGAVAATALLSGGRLGPAVPGAPADLPTVYLTSNPAPLLARVGPALVLSNDPTQLAQAIRAASEWLGSPFLDSGWLVRVEPPLIADQFPTLTGRRVHEVFRARRTWSSEGRLRVEGTSLVADWRATTPGRLPYLKGIDPRWAAIVPAQGALAAWACRVDPRPEAWSHLFELVDRVERLDPARAQVAPSRFRLALAALALGVRLEADVLPHLVGISGWVGPDGGDLAGQGVAALHLDAEGTARRLVAGIRATRRPGPPRDARPVDHADDTPVDLGRVSGRAVRLHRLGESVVLAWGDRAWAAALDARDHPERSARDWLTTSRSGFAPSRAGAVWLDQALQRVPGAAELAASLADGPPLRWAGHTYPDEYVGKDGDEVWLDGVDGTIRRFLDRLPLDPPPDH